VVRGQVCDDETLHAYPFSFHSQKVLVALWENNVHIDDRHLEEPGAMNAMQTAVDGAIRPG